MKFVKKPWGNFKQFVLNKKCTVKILTIAPFQKLSLQKHKNRKEEWYFLSQGIVQIGKKHKRVKKGETVRINKNTSHRIIAGKNKIDILEIAFGNFDENDIIRLEDDYGR